MLPDYLTFNNIKIPIIKKIKLDIHAETMGGRVPLCPKERAIDSITQ